MADSKDKININLNNQIKIQEQELAKNAVSKKSETTSNIKISETNTFITELLKTSAFQKLFKNIEIIKDKTESLTNENIKTSDTLNKNIESIKEIDSDISKQLLTIYTQLINQDTNLIKKINDNNYFKDLVDGIKQISTSLKTDFNKTNLDNFSNTLNETIKKIDFSSLITKNDLTEILKNYKVSISDNEFQNLSKYFIDLQTSVNTKLDILNDSLTILINTKNNSKDNSSTNTSINTLNTNINNDIAEIKSKLNTSIPVNIQNIQQTLSIPNNNENLNKVIIDINNKVNADIINKNNTVDNDKSTEIINKKPNKINNTNNINNENINDIISTLKDINKQNKNINIIEKNINIYQNNDKQLLHNLNKKQLSTINTKSDNLSLNKNKDTLNQNQLEKQGINYRQNLESDFFTNIISNNLQQESLSKKKIDISKVGNQPILEKNIFIQKENDKPISKKVISLTKMDFINNFNTELDLSNINIKNELNQNNNNIKEDLTNIKSILNTEFTDTYICDILNGTKKDEFIKLINSENIDNIKQCIELIEEHINILNIDLEKNKNTEIIYYYLDILSNLYKYCINLYNNLKKQNELNLISTKNKELKERLILFKEDKTSNNAIITIAKPIKKESNKINTKLTQNILSNSIENLNLDLKEKTKMLDNLEIFSQTNISNSLDNTEKEQYSLLKDIDTYFSKINLTNIELDEYTKLLCKEYAFNNIQYFFEKDNISDINKREISKTLIPQFLTDFINEYIKSKKYLVFDKDTNKTLLIDDFNIAKKQLQSDLVFTSLTAYKNKELILNTNNIENEESKNLENIPNIIVESNPTDKLQINADTTKSAASIILNNNQNESNISTNNSKNKHILTSEIVDNTKNNKMTHQNNKESISSDIYAVNPETNSTEYNNLVKLAKTNYIDLQYNLNAKDNPNINEKLFKQQKAKEWDESYKNNIILNYELSAENQENGIIRKENALELKKQYNAKDNTKKEISIVKRINEVKEDLKEKFSSVKDLINFEKELLSDVLDNTEQTDQNKLNITENTTANELTTIKPQSSSTNLVSGQDKIQSTIASSIQREKQVSNSIQNTQQPIQQSNNEDFIQYMEQNIQTNNKVLLALQNIVSNTASNHNITIINKPPAPFPNIFTNRENLNIF